MAATLLFLPRYTYLLGIMDVLLHQLGLVGPECHVSGASSGALVAVFTKCGLPMRKVLDLTNKFSQVSVALRATLVDRQLN
jgi:hypothetical protein